MAAEKRPQFSVYAFTEEAQSIRMADNVTANQAIEIVRRLIASVAGRTGEVRRIIITEGGDQTCFEWDFLRGVRMAFPPEG